MSTIPSTGQLGGTPTNAQFQGYIEDFRDFVVESVLGASARYELTIASGAVTPPDGATAGGGVYTLDTEGNAASDTLDTITQTNTHDGQILLVMAENAARVVTLNHAAGGTGQLLLEDDTDFVFASLDAWVAFQRRGTDWVEIQRHVPLDDLTSLTTPDIADELRIWDDSAGTEKRISTARVGRVVQIVEATPYTTWSSTTNQIPYDDTVPQNTEGSEYLTASITPTKSTHRLIIEAMLPVSASGGAVTAVAALFQDSTASALAATATTVAGADYMIPLVLRHEMAAGTTSATTFKIRAGRGGVSGSILLNGSSAERKFGGLAACRLRITEVVA